MTKKKNAFFRHVQEPELLKAAAVMQCHNQLALSFRGWELHFLPFKVTRVHRLSISKFFDMNLVLKKNNT